MPSGNVQQHKIQGAADEGIFSKSDKIIFSIFFPLYYPLKRPNIKWQITNFVLKCIFLLSLSTYWINPVTFVQSTLSKIGGYISFSSYSFLLGNYSLYFPIGIFILLLCLIMWLILFASFHQKIMRYHPFFMRILQITFIIIFQTFYIPLINLALPAIDCYKPIPDQKSIITSGTDECFGSSVLQLVSAIVSIAVNLPFILIIATGSSFPTHNRHSKKGGIFSIKQGQIIAFDRFLLFGVVFAMRFLFDWPFWRFFVTVGTSSLLVFIYTVIQPYYHIIGNYLSALPYLLFGLIRAFAELAYFASGASKNETNIITFSLLWAIGLVCAGVASVFLFFIIRKIEQKHWCLNKDGSPLVSISAIYSAAMEQKTSSLGDKVKMYLQDQDSTQETQSKHDQVFRQMKLQKSFPYAQNVNTIMPDSSQIEDNVHQNEIDRTLNKANNLNPNIFAYKAKSNYIRAIPRLTQSLPKIRNPNNVERRLSTFDETEIPGTLMRMHKFGNSKQASRANLSRMQQYSMQKSNPDSEISYASDQRGVSPDPQNQPKSVSFKAKKSLNQSVSKSSLQNQQLQLQLQDDFMISPDTSQNNEANSLNLFDNKSKGKRRGSFEKNLIQETSNENVTDQYQYDEADKEGEQIMQQLLKEQSEQEKEKRNKEQANERENQKYMLEYLAKKEQEQESISQSNSEIDFNGGTIRQNSNKQLQIDKTKKNKELDQDQRIQQIFSSPLVHTPEKDKEQFFTISAQSSPVDLNKEYENMTLTRSKAKMAKFGQMFTPVQINQASNPNNPDILPLIEEESTTKDQNSNTLQDPHKFNGQKQGENKIKKKWGSLVGIVNNLKRKESSTNQIEKNPSLLLSAQSSDKTKDEGKREQDDEEEIQSPQSQSQKGTYLKHAIELHNLSITALKEFWRMASENVVNFKHLGKSVERLQQQERAALHEYEEQMSTHPQDQNLYILFSTFFRQIFNDQELADVLLIKANRLLTEENLGNNQNEQDLQKSGYNDDFSQSKLQSKSKPRWNTKRLLVTLDPNVLLKKYSLIDRSMLTLFLLTTLAYIFYSIFIAVSSATHFNTCAQFYQLTINLQKVASVPDSIARMGYAAMGYHFHEQFNWIWSNVDHPQFRYKSIFQDSNQNGDNSIGQYSIGSIEQQEKLHQSKLSKSNYNNKENVLFDYNFSNDSINNSNQKQIKINIQQSTINDEDAPFIASMTSFAQILRDNAKLVEGVTSQIYSLTSDSQEFEVQSIQIYEFGFDTDNKKVISQASMRVNLITALNQLVNRCKTLGSSTSPQIDLPTYRQDLLYIVFNTLLPVMESAKKAVVNCLLTTQELARYAPINSIAIVLTGAGVAIIGLLLLYGYSIFQMFSKSRSAFRRAAISRHDSMLMNLKAMEDIHPVNEQTIEEITKKLNEFVKNQEIAADITKQETAKDTQQGNAESLLQDHDLDTNKQLFIPTNRLGQVNKKLTVSQFKQNFKPNSLISQQNSLKNLDISEATTLQSQQKHEKLIQPKVKKEAQKYNSTTLHKVNRDKVLSSMTPVQMGNQSSLQSSNINAKSLQRLSHSWNDSQYKLIESSQQAQQEQSQPTSQTPFQNIFQEKQQIRQVNQGTGQMDDSIIKTNNNQKDQNIAKIENKEISNQNIKASVHPDIQQKQIINDNQHKDDQSDDQSSSDSSDESRRRRKRKRRRRRRKNKSGSRRSLSESTDSSSTSQSQSSEYSRRKGRRRKGRGRRRSNDRSDQSEDSDDRRKRSHSSDDDSDSDSYYERNRHYSDRKRRRYSDDSDSSSYDRREKRRSKQRKISNRNGNSERKRNIDDINQMQVNERIVGLKLAQDQISHNPNDISQSHSPAANSLLQPQGSERIDPQFLAQIQNSQPLQAYLQLQNQQQQIYGQQIQQSVAPNLTQITPIQQQQQQGVGFDPLQSQLINVLQAPNQTNFLQQSQQLQPNSTGLYPQQFVQSLSIEQSQSVQQPYINNQQIVQNLVLTQQQLQQALINQQTLQTYNEELLRLLNLKQSGVQNETINNLLEKVQSNNLDKELPEEIDEKEKAKIPNEVKLKEIELSQKAESEIYVQGVIDDSKWAQRLDEEINELRITFKKQFPQPISLSFISLSITSILICLVITVAIMCMFLAIDMRFSSIPSSLIVSSFRIPILRTMQCVLIRACFPDSPTIATFDRILFPTATNPVWNSSDHISDDPRVLVGLLTRLADYIQALHIRTHFSKQNDNEYNLYGNIGDSSFTNDIVFDDKKMMMRRFSSNVNELILFRKQESLMHSSNDGDQQLDSELGMNQRIWNIGDYVYGMSQLLSRLRIYLEVLGSQETNEDIIKPLDYKSNYFKFILSSIDNDVVGAVQWMNNQILEQANYLVGFSSTALTVFLPFSFVFLLMAYLFNGISLMLIYSTSCRNSNRLRELLPPDTRSCCRVVERTIKEITAIQIEHEKKRDKLHIRKERAQQMREKMRDRLEKRKKEKEKLIGDLKSDQGIGQQSPRNQQQNAGKNTAEVINKKIQQDFYEDNEAGHQVQDTQPLITKEISGSSLKSPENASVKNKVLKRRSSITLSRNSYQTQQANAQQLYFQTDSQPNTYISSHIPSPTSQYAHQYQQSYQGNLHSKIHKAVLDDSFIPEKLLELPLVFQRMSAHLLSGNTFLDGIHLQILDVIIHFADSVWQCGFSGINEGTLAGLLRKKSKLIHDAQDAGRCMLITLRDTFKKEDEKILIILEKINNKTKLTDKDKQIARDVSGYIDKPVDGKSQQKTQMKQPDNTQHSTIQKHHTQQMNFQSKILFHRQEKLRLRQRMTTLCKLDFQDTATCVNIAEAALASTIHYIIVQGHLVFSLVNSTLSHRTQGKMTQDYKKLMDISHHR